MITKRNSRKIFFSVGNFNDFPWAVAFWKHIVYDVILRFCCASIAFRHTAKFSIRITFVPVVCNRRCHDFHQPLLSISTLRRNLSPVLRSHGVLYIMPMVSAIRAVRIAIGERKCTSNDCGKTRYTWWVKRHDIWNYSKINVFF